MADYSAVVENLDEAWRCFARAAHWEEKPHMANSLRYHREQGLKHAAAAAEALDGVRPLAADIADVRERLLALGGHGHARP